MGSVSKKARGSIHPLLELPSQSLTWNLKMMVCKKESPRVPSSGSMLNFGRVGVFSLLLIVLLGLLG